MKSLAYVAPLWKIASVRRSAFNKELERTSERTDVIDTGESAGKSICPATQLMCPKRFSEEILLKTKTKLASLRYTLCPLSSSMKQGMPLGLLAYVGCWNLSSSMN